MQERLTNFKNRIKKNNNVPKKVALMILFCFLVLSSCNNTEVKYFNTGEIQEEIKNSDNNCKDVLRYYKNGQKASSGKICDNLKESSWQEWYVDGMIKWEGEYKNGKPHYKNFNLKELNCALTIKGNPDTLQTDITYPIRVSIVGIHPQDILVTTNNGVIYFDENRDEYDYKIIPEKKGPIKLYTFVEIEHQKELACEISLQVK